MNGRFPNTQLFKFPRMSKEDTELWRKFLENWGQDYKSFDYDLPVGEGEDPGDIVAENLRKDFIDLTKKRIDAVGYSNGSATIFEVKPRAGTTALGQLLTYKALFKESKPEFSTVNLAVVTSLINTDERKVYEANDIEIFLV